MTREELRFEVARLSNTNEKREPIWWPDSLGRALRWRYFGLNGTGTVTNTIVNHTRDIAAAFGLWLLIESKRSIKFWPANDVILEVGEGQNWRCYSGCADDIAFLISWAYYEYKTGIRVEASNDN